jgi:hypothetical protein
MPDWPEVLAGTQDPPVPELLYHGTPVVAQTFYASVDVSENLLIDNPAVIDYVRERLRHAIAGEMFLKNHEPVAAEVLEWGQDPDFFIRRYVMTQQGVPAESRLSTGHQPAGRVHSSWVL